MHFYKINLGWLNLYRFLCLFIAFLCGCSSYDAQHRAIFQAYYQNNFSTAEQLTDQVLDSMGRNDEDRPLLLLESASIALAMGNQKKATACLREADAMTEVLDLSGDPGQVGKYLFSDSSGMYRIQPHEQIMTNVLNAIAYLSINDLQGANVEIKRAKSQEEYWVGLRGQNMAQNALLQMLGALVSIKSNKISDASFYTRELGKFIGQEEAKNLVKPLGKGEKEILVVVINGKAPVKREVKEFIPGSQIARIISHTGYTGDYLIYPALTVRHSPFSYAEVSVGSASFGPCIDLLNLESQALSWYEQQRTRIMIAAATRMAFRAAASTAAAKGTEYALRDKNKKDNDESARIIGSLIGSLTKSVMEAVDAADTRCWTLLPKNILVKRVVGNFPDQVSVNLTIRGSSYSQLSKQLSLGNGINVALFITP
ncbi:MAG: hypothetical protein HUU50_20570 [Candidatus Brocadiae bacterium]|nr:hypothetical protein [Candidatus Brocadiia bacterium]